MFEVWNMKWVLEWPLLTIFKVPNRFRKSFLQSTQLCANVWYVSSWQTGSLWFDCKPQSSFIISFVQPDSKGQLYKDNAVKGVDWWRGRMTWPDQGPPVHCISFHHQQFIRLLLFLNNVQRYIGNIYIGDRDREYIPFLQANECFIHNPVICLNPTWHLISGLYQFTTICCRPSG